LASGLINQGQNRQFPCFGAGPGQKTEDIYYAA
jgi:hypothetical protein